ncbi:MAG TPA: hypothetical protein VGL44_12310 [Gaiellales bacterium]
MANLVAHLVEQCEVDGRGPVATGLFSCDLYWVGDEPLPPDPVQSPPEDLVPLDEAVAWGRAHSERVAVRIACEDYFSAGAVPLPDPPVDESRVLGRRRPTGWEFLDRPDSEAPISWDVILDVDTRSAGMLATGGTRTDLGERWRAALEDSGPCGLVEMTDTGADGQIQAGDRWFTMSAMTPVAVLRLEAGGYEGAIRAAVAAAGRAAATAGWEPAPAFSVEHLFATASHAARRNARLGNHGILF